MDHSGIFIAIEGTDGSGHKVQFRRLRDELVKEGYSVASFDFPRYDQPSGYFAKQYSDGKYGSTEAVGPYTGSLFYALDRYQTAQAIRKALEEGKVVLANRFTGFSMADQGAKFTHPEERRGFFIWLDNLEYQMLGIPRPDKSIVLRAPADSQSQRTLEVYDDLCQLFPKDFTRIDCQRGGELLDTATIYKLVRETIAPLLPAKQTPMSSSSSAAPKLEYVTPKSLNTATARLYDQQIEQILGLHAELSQKLANHLKSELDAQTVAIMQRLLPASIVLPGSRQAAAAPFIKSASGLVQDIANQHLPDQLAPAANGVDLVSFTPRNELDLVTDILYDQSNLSLHDISAEVDKWPYERKLEVLQAYVGQPGTKKALDKVTYNWDLVTSFDTLVSFARSGLGTGLEWQALTPRYGYKVPKTIDQAGLSDLFEQCFDISLGLYSQLQAAGYQLEAQYATLLGHKQRWSVTLSGSDVNKLLKLASDQTQLAGLAKQISLKLLEVHPLIAAAG